MYPSRERDVYLPDHEQSAVDYLRRERSPFVAAENTGKMLNLYFGGVIIDPSYTQRFLSDYTLPYLESTGAGLRNIANQLRQTPDQFPIFFPTTNIPYDGGSVESREALGYTLVIFSVLPEMTSLNALPNGFSRRGMLHPPTTTQEFYERLSEMQREINKIRDGSTTSSLPVTQNIPLFRTYAFFGAARNLELKVPESHYEKEERAREVFANLLGDLDIKL